MANVDELQCWKAGDADVAHLIARARAHWERNERTEALSLLRSVAFAAPAAPTAWTTLAELHASLGDTETASTLTVLGELLAQFRDPKGAS